MAVVVIISVIAVTIAWFRLNDSAWANGLSLGTARADYIRVALEAGGPDVTTLTEEQRQIDINMPNFYNVEKNSEGDTLLAPGVSGELKLYITALSPSVTSCRINTECIPVLEEDNDLTEEQIENLDQLLQGHIQFYRQRTQDAVTGEYTYSGLIGETSNSGQYATFTLDLVQDVEKPVTIYWVWFYEYTDIPAEGTARQDAGYYYDVERLKAYMSANGMDVNAMTKDEWTAYLGTMTEQEQILYYDYGDTLIGLNVPEVQFHIVVDALDDAGTVITP